MGLMSFYEEEAEKEMAAHSSILAWRIPGTEEPGWAAIHGVAQNQTRLKQLSSSSSSMMGKRANLFSVCLIRT